MRSMERSKPTVRELEVLQLAVNGLSDKQIAGQLSVAPATVRKHVHNLCRKLGAENRCHLTAFALGAGFVRTPASPMG